MTADYSTAIVGFGSVGRGLAELFQGSVIYDPALGFHDRAAVNRCRFAFVCVPTPALADGSCDASAVEESVAWIESEYIVIRSTVPPGTTDALAERYARRIIFQPEYGPGETPDHPFRDVRAISWVLLGGPEAWTTPVAALYKRVFNANLQIQKVDAKTAELAKYMENAFLAVKVAFCNEFYDLAARLDIDYDVLRESWLMDPRIGRSHTWVHPDDRGFGGKCLPKDLTALLSVADTLGYTPELLAGAMRSNRALRGEAG